MAKLQSFDMTTYEFRAFKKVFTEVLQLCQNNDYQAIAWNFITKFSVFIQYFLLRLTAA